LIDSSSNPASLRRFQIASSLRGVFKTLEPGVIDKGRAELGVIASRSGCGLAISASETLRFPLFLFLLRFGPFGALATLDLSLALHASLLAFSRITH